MKSSQTSTICAHKTFAYSTCYLELPFFPTAYLLLFTTKKQANFKIVADRDFIFLLGVVDNFEYLLLTS